MPEKFPVMVFSHGLGGMRTTYSYICADIASHGWCVAAIEHRDGSASMALTDAGPFPYEHPVPGLQGEEFAFLSRLQRISCRPCARLSQMMLCKSWTSISFSVCRTTRPMWWEYLGGWGRVHRQMVRKS